MSRACRAGCSRPGDSELPLHRALPAQEEGAARRQGALLGPGAGAREVWRAGSEPGRDRQWEALGEPVDPPGGRPCRVAGTGAAEAAAPQCHPRAHLPDALALEEPVPRSGGPWERTLFLGVHVSGLEVGRTRAPVSRIQRRVLAAQTRPGSSNQLQARLGDNRMSFLTGVAEGLCFWGGSTCCVLPNSGVLGFSSGGKNVPFPTLCCWRKISTYLRYAHVEKEIWVFFETSC